MIHPVFPRTHTVYLQFDSFKQSALTHLRGLDLREIRINALEHLNKHNISTTLVVTLQKGVNDDEIGSIIDFALQHPCVRGVTFQPTQFAGRLEKVDPKIHRYTLTEVRQAILDQTTVFEPNDIIPVPCNPDGLAMGYALKWQGKVQPLTRFINPDDLIRQGRNTIVYEQDDAIAKHMLQLFSTGNSVETASGELKSLLCCLPQIATKNLKYENVFRIIIMQFIDAYNFDVRAIKKSCVHIVTPAGKLIPFETMNLFYRDEEKRQRLKQIRDKII